MINVPSIITSSPSGGRFDFDDGGTYCGGWQDGKAHGHGVCTGPKNVGEYSGSWNFGFEMSGVYKWTNGAVYEGRWQNGKRHGVGVEYNGKWIYKGEWSQGLKGRYGVKASSNSAVKYEGTWANGLQDGYGSETYSDGGYYQGQMCRGLRHGYGVRKSAPYGDSQLNNPGKNGPLTGGPPSSRLLHANSVQSAGSAADLNDNDNNDDSPKPEDGFKPNIDRTLVSKNGFVLVAKPLDSPMPTIGSSNASQNSKYSPTDQHHHHQSSLADGGGGWRRNSASNSKFLPNSARIPSKSQAAASILRGLRLRKQKSTSDLDTINAGVRSPPNNRYNSGINNNNSNSNQLEQTGDLQPVPFTLSPEELDITDPTTVETYMGDWKHDKRNGHGVCDRSDGLKYEGQWHNDMKFGYGVTTFKDGTKEEGKYKNNFLIADSKVKRFFQLGGTNIRQRIDDAVKLAQQAQGMALKKAEIAETRAATARDKADQAMTAAIEADRDSQIAYSVARQYSDSQQQLAMQQQQQQQFANSMAGQPPPPMSMANTNHGHQMLASGGGVMPPTGYASDGMLQTNLNLSSSPLQMRRISQNQRQQQQQHQTFNNQMDHHQQQQQQQQQIQHLDQLQHQQHQINNLTDQHQQQFLGPIEPFNGRRGSFRGGSQPPLGTGSSRYQPGGGGSSLFNQQQQQNHHRRRHPPVGRQSSDPFSDMFDHYKSSGGGGQSASSVAGGLARARRQLGAKQTSLDYSQLRASVPRQMSGASHQVASQLDANDPAGAMSLGRQSSMRRSRMSSLDNAQEEQYRQQQQGLAAADDMHQQFKHLVTSGEELQQAAGQSINSTPTIGGHNNNNNNNTNEQQRNQEDQLQQRQQHLAQTPTGSSYLGAPQSSTAGSSSIRTPSPMDSTFTGAGNLIRQPISQAHDNINHHQLPATATYSVLGYPNAQNPSRQRDVHSLADEQLYLTDYRRRQQLRDDILDKTEYSNYDFAIINAPRPSQRCMRRTASLSRPMLARPLSCSAGQRAPSQLDFLRPTSLSQNMLAFNNQNQQQQSARSASSMAPQHPPPISTRLTHSSLDRGGAETMAYEQHNQYPAIDTSQCGDLSGTQLANSINQHPYQYANNPSHHLMPLDAADGLSSSAASGGLLIRKPSLQVRYDLLQLGGLMSREEVAHLSHAQREQKRLELEMAEKRAKRPLLHLYLSIRENITNHRLIISVLFVNLCLLKLVVDLIA